jgi:hypothetical protein
MTEAEWLACTDPERMLIHLSHRADKLDRKLRLFAVACCYRLSDSFPGPCSRRALEVAERYADGQSSPDELERQSNGARTEQHAASSAVVTLASAAAAEAASARAWSAARKASLQSAWCVGEKAGLQAGIAERHGQCTLLRDIIGNTFRPSPPLPAAVLAWSNRTVPRIAQGIYDERQMPQGTLDNARLAILADALLDAGCDDEDLITHCRSHEAHVRGCWAVDLILGRE